jgi:hypothetical protein
MCGTVYALSKRTVLMSVLDLNKCVIPVNMNILLYHLGVSSQKQKLQAVILITISFEKKKHINSIRN